MFCRFANVVVNPVSAFNQNYDRIGFFIDILVNGLYYWLTYERHFSVAPVVCYGVAKSAASNYWMFMHPTIGCKSNSWNTSGSWILAESDNAMPYGILSA